MRWSTARLHRPDSSRRFLHTTAVAFTFQGKRYCAVRGAAARRRGPPAAASAMLLLACRRRPSDQASRARRRGQTGNACMHRAAVCSRAGMNQSWHGTHPRFPLFSFILQASFFLGPLSDRILDNFPSWLIEWRINWWWCFPVRRLTLSFFFLLRFSFRAPAARVKRPCCERRKKILCLKTPTQSMDWNSYSSAMEKEWIFSCPILNYHKFNQIYRKHNSS